ncbi:BLUF domain-containing protein [Parvularcula sp. LCG005]|uniref:BLUF domain-containing protein n=1 Tax=Parvularcula sp. LCG005 TaxID=3078805 RepID=UPI002941CB3A|nr:BLUF domain-containing protein [Parvularcula sp. LCG005]WOI54434.1 BLUF domain-containing protein [Parvularcula sp. LCG005]
MIYQKIYSSRRYPGTSQLCLDQILRSSTVNNHTLDITGLLLVEGGRFFQIIEGPRDNVELLYAIIGRDLRHGELHPIANRRREERSFPHWSMAFREADTIEHGSNCFELSHDTVMWGPLARCDTLLRGLVEDFLQQAKPDCRGCVEFFGDLAPSETRAH